LPLGEYYVELLSKRKTGISSTEGAVYMRMIKTREAALYIIQYGLAAGWHRLNEDDDSGAVSDTPFEDKSFRVVTQSHFLITSG